MTKPKQPTPGEHKDAEQRRRFNKAARELGCDENEERFQEKLRTVAKHKPASQVREDGDPETKAKPTKEGR